MMSNPNEHAVVQTDCFNTASQRLIGRDVVRSRQPLSGEEYLDIREFLRALRKALVPLAGPATDMIDVQSFLWTVIKLDPNDTREFRYGANRLMAKQRSAAIKDGDFDANSVSDAREKAMRQVVMRRGQGWFRATLISIYAGKCAVTECDANQVLEAAHVKPYAGADTQHHQNGILLRADIHTLFDLGLMTFSKDGLHVEVSSRLAKTEYWKFHGQPLALPEHPEFRPSASARDAHREWYHENNKLVH